MPKQFNLYRLYKRGEIYHAYFSFIQNGERIQFRETTHTSNREQAEEYCLNRIRKFQLRAKNEYTLDEVFGRFWEENGQYQVSKVNLQNNFKDFLKFWNGNKIFSNLTPDDISKYIAFKKQQGLKNSSINRALDDLNAVFNACRKKWMWKIPEINISNFKLKVPAENIKYFSHQEINLILQYSAPHLKNIIKTALYTGLRKSNILNLKWDDINFETKTITVKVKDAKKIGGKNHTIPISDELDEILIQQPKINDYVFNYKNKPIKDIKKAFIRAQERAKIPYRSFHTLRHTCATWLIANGIDVRVVQKILGHSNIAVTMKYAHILDEQKQQAVNTLKI